MKTRHIAAILVGAALTSWAVMSCSLNNSSNGVSIDQRISNFQADLNTTDRANVYQDFHPSETSQYNALKNAEVAGINQNFPRPGASYALSVVTESDQTAVVVKLTGPNGVSYTSPYFLKLKMDTYNSNDYRIVNLSISQSQGGPYTMFYQ